MDGHPFGPVEERNLAHEVEYAGIDRAGTRFVRLRLDAKCAGIGREGGGYSHEFFTESKAVVIKLD